VSAPGGTKSLKEEREADWRRMRGYRWALTIMFALVAVTPLVIFWIHSAQGRSPELLDSNANDISGGVGIAAAGIPVLWLTRSTYDLAGGMTAVAGAVAGFGVDRIWASILGQAGFVFVPISTRQRIVLVVTLGALSMIFVFTGKHVEKRREAKARALEMRTYFGSLIQFRRDRANERFDELAHRQNVFLHSSFPSFAVVFAVFSLIVFVSV